MIENVKILISRFPNRISNWFIVLESIAFSSSSKPSTLLQAMMQQFTWKIPYFSTWLKQHDTSRDKSAITWQSMFKEVTWQKFEATIWFKNDLTFWAFDREINQTRIPDPWDHLNIHNESEMNYHEYSDSVHRHVIRLPRDHFTITWP